MAAHRYWRLKIITTGTTGSHGNQATAMANEIELRSAAGGTNRCTGGTALSSSRWPNRYESYAFDGVAGSGDYWRSYYMYGAPVYIGYDFGSGVAWDIVQIAYTCTGDPEYAPLTWALQWSDTGDIYTDSEWTDASWQPAAPSSWSAWATQVFPNELSFTSPTASLALSLLALTVSPRQCTAPAAALPLVAGVPRFSPLQAFVPTANLPMAALAPGYDNTLPCLALGLTGLAPSRGQGLAAAPLLAVPVAATAPSYRWEAPAGSTPVYLLTLTGAADGLDDVTLPLASFDARVRSGEPSYLQAVVPNAYAWAQAIADRPNGDLVVKRGVLLASGSYLVEEIARVNLELIADDRGGQSATVTLSGHKTQTTATPKTLSLSGVSYRHTGTGTKRYRCTPDTFLRPGDTASFPELGGESIVVGSLSYSVSPGREQMELTEAEA